MWVWVLDHVVCTCVNMRNTISRGRWLGVGVGCGAEDQCQRDIWHVHVSVTSHFVTLFS